MNSGWTGQGPRRVCWLIALGTFLLNAPAFGTSQVTLAWDASVSTVSGYRLYYGVSSRDYTNVTDVGSATTTTVSNLVSSTTYFFAVTAYDLVGLESDFSTELSYTVPTPSPILQLASRNQSVVLTANGQPGSAWNLLTTTNLLAWQQLTNLILDAGGAFQFSVPASTDESARFFRLQQASP